MGGLDDAPYQTTASMHLAAAKILLSPNKRFYFTPTESQTGVCLAGEASKSLANAMPWAKKADEGMAASGFRNRLLGTRLSVLAEACQVIFLR